ncbi:MAG: class II fructose-bisphosphate aldolase, partial [Actinobacteria bacterium]|nr:class II fructose-bisphosphate aldolase [Actinomycetota bacterium]
MPVGLDHGFNFDSVMRAIKAGCTTVMFDGSRLSFKDNIKITKEIVRTAHSLGVSVEGEIGIVGGLGETDELPKLNNENKISTVSDVKRFIEETGVDAVAIAVGNVHGIVKEPVKINFNRISEIRNAIDTPLVLHGGSGLSDAVFKRAIENGICKINYYTDLIYNATLEIKKRLNG